MHAHHLITSGDTAPAPTELNGWPTANIALVVSALAAAIAIIAVIYTIRTFRRAGARVKVNLHRRKWLFNDIGGAPLLAEIVSLDISNGGLASIQISEVSWETKDKESFSLPPDISTEDTPRILDGLSADLSAYRVDRLTSAAEADDKIKRIRAVVLLAGTRVEKSPWIDVG